MKCIKCKKTANLKVQNEHVCRSCFLKIIEKRVRRDLRISKLIKKNDRILLIDNNSAAAKASIYLFRKITAALPAIIKEKKTRYDIGQEITGKFTKIIIPWTADDEDEYLLLTIFENKKLNYLGNFRKKEKVYIKLLLSVSESEAEMFCTILNFEYKKQKKTVIRNLLDKFEAEHPEVKFSLLKSAKELKKII
jgi:hypothetical protein